MDINIEDGFKIISSRTGKSLLVESDRLDDYLNYAIENKITGIALLEYHGYKLHNIDFLKNVSMFTDVWVRNYLNDIDISAIHHLKGLKYLNLSNHKQLVDFAFFPNLNFASLDWNNKIVNLDKPKKLAEVRLFNFKPKSKSFLEICGINNLESLQITESNIVSFEGFEKLSSLESFDGAYLTKLECLTGIQNARETLKVLVLEKCGKLKAFGKNLEQLKNLKKLVLTDCGELNDVKFIEAMPALKFFSFVGTNILDGNLSSLLARDFEFVGFDDKRHYSHKMKQINPLF